MKNLLLAIFSILILWSCDSNTKPEVKNENKTETTENLEWLIGKWKRSNNESGKTTFETWHKINKKEYKGNGYTLSNNDTISMENMTISKANNKWKLAVITKDEETPTYFNIIKIDNNSFTCENKDIDFPNKIHYWKDGETLKATVSNSDINIDFIFEKSK